MTNQEHELEGPSGFVPLIAIWNIAIWPDFGKGRVQEVIHGQTPLIVPEMDGCPVQKQTDCITRIEEFKR